MITTAAHVDAMFAHQDAAQAHREAARTRSHKRAMVAWEATEAAFRASQNAGHPADGLLSSQLAEAGCAIAQNEHDDKREQAGHHRNAARMHSKSAIHHSMAG